MEIFVVRHGQTDWNVCHKVQGSCDIELNDKGIEQAGITAEKLKSDDFDIIICSPLKRARQTAEIINQGRNILIVYDDRIAERNFGDYEGKVVDFKDVGPLWNYNLNYNLQNI